MEYKTGDMLLFKGDSVTSRFITALPGADYSHVGFYYDHPTFGPSVFESTSIGNDPDLFTHEIIKGVQLTPFNDRVANYGGEVFIRPLLEPLNATQIDVFDEFISTYHGTPYESDEIELMRAELDFLPWQANEQDESTLFCSELGKKLCRELELIEDDGTPTNEDTPTDCAGYAGYSDEITLLA